MKLDDGFCDSGAGVNVISFEIVNRLGINNMKLNSFSLMLVDAFPKYPLCFTEDYTIKVESYLVPTDFTVVKLV